MKTHQQQEKAEISFWTTVPEGWTERPNVFDLRLYFSGNNDLGTQVSNLVILHKFPFVVSQKPPASILKHLFMSTKIEFGEIPIWICPFLFKNRIPSNNSTRIILQQQTDKLYFSNWTAGTKLSGRGSYNKVICSGFHTIPLTITFRGNFFFLIH